VEILSLKQMMSKYAGTLHLVWWSLWLNVAIPEFYGPNRSVFVEKQNLRTVQVVAWTSK
jgi:hypothetical protein